MRNKYRIVEVDGKNKSVRRSDFPKAWGARRIFHGAKLTRGHTLRLYRRRPLLDRRGHPATEAYRLIAERGRGPRELIR